MGRCAAARGPSLEEDTAMKIASFAIALAAAASVFAFAGETCSVSPNEKLLSAEEVQVRLQKKGYDVRRVKREGLCFEVSAVKDGKRVKAYVSAVDASIVREKVKDPS